MRQRDGGVRGDLDVGFQQRRVVLAPCGQPRSLNPRSRTVVPGASREVTVRLVESSRCVGLPMSLTSRNRTQLACSSASVPVDAQRVAVREVQPDAGIDHAGPGQFGQLGELAEGPRVTAGVAGDDHGAAGGTQPFGEAPQRRGVGSQPRRHAETAEVWQRDRLLEGRFLESGVEGDVDRAARLGHRDPVGPR